MSAGLGTFHCPVDIRFSSVWTAVMVSAGVNAQCPARSTKTWRSRLPWPARSTTLRYACSFSGTTRPSPVVCMVSTGTRMSPLKEMFLASQAVAFGLALIRGELFSVCTSWPRLSPAAW